MTRRRAIAAAVAAAIAGSIALVATVHPTAASTDGLRCPAGTKAMQAVADYDQSEHVDGFDTPEAALEYLTSTVYPGMPPGQLRRAAVQDGAVVFRGEPAIALAVELDVRRRPTPDAPVVVEESGTEWVVQAFGICEVNAKRWGR